MQKGAICDIYAHWIQKSQISISAKDVRFKLGVLD